MVAFAGVAGAYPGRLSMRSPVLHLVVATSFALAVAACGGGDNAPSGQGGSPDAGVDSPSGDDGAAQRESGADGNTPDAAPGDASNDGGSNDAPSDDGGPDGAGTFDAGTLSWPQVSAPSPPTVLAPLKLVTIVVQGDPQAAHLFAFGDALVTGSWYSSFASEYGLGKPNAQTVHVTGPTIPPNTSRADPNNPGMFDMAAYIQSLIANQTAPAPDPHTMYMLYLPPGIAAYDDNAQISNTNCQLYGGYHTAYDTLGQFDSGLQSAVVWGFVQRCGSTQILLDADWLTLAASHEIAEAATDPLPPEGWTAGLLDPHMPWTHSVFAALGGEVGDMCQETKWNDGTFTYQRIWSNAAAMRGVDPCVPAYQNIPYVNVVGPQGWTMVSAGGVVQLALTGYSDRPAPDWFVYSVIGPNTDPGMHISATVTSATEVRTSAGLTATTNVGKPARLTVSAAPGTASGTWAVVEVVSQPEVPNGGDTLHIWPVGVYVP
jgi:hypothetical protein